MRAMECATSCSATDFPSSRCIEVTGLSVIPHGTIRSKKLRSVFTLRAKPCEVTPQQLIFQSLSTVGYSLPAAIARRSTSVVQRDYLALSRLVATGRLSIPVLAAYPMVAIATALKHAAESGRDGKILVLANA